MTGPTYKVFVSSSGNVFMAEVAAAIADAIEATGREVSRHSRGLPQADPGTINLVVSPHEYFFLLEGHSEAEIVRAASHSVTLGVEQPGTPWFEVGARYASYGPIAVDIGRQAVRELQHRGIEAYHLQLGYHPGWDDWGGDDGTERGVDLLFLGSLTGRRAEFLAESAGILSEWHCDLRVFEVTGPVKRGNEHFLTGREKYSLLAGSRVLLNVHQGARDYFEWVRIIEAMSNGCLVVTETSRGFAPLRPAEHFVQSGLSSLAGRADACLRDEDLRAELARSSYDYLRNHLALVDSVDRLLPIIERRCSPRPGAAGGARPTHPAVSALERPGRRRPISAVPASTAQSSAFDEVLGGERQMRTAIKDLLLHEIREMRMIEALASELAHGDRTYIEVFETSCYPDIEPEVSVVMPLFNYGEYVRGAIESVMANENVVCDLVIVDDHSGDDSVAIVRQVMADYDRFPIRLVVQGANRGPSPTRNRGIEHARADLVMMLDADNFLYPRSLETLVAALKGSDAAFAYGILDVFGERSGLLSYLPWDVDRLVRGNYIDAMALLRKSAWEKVGGFDPSADGTGGLDDYDFWLHLAAEGERGEFVREFVGRYRAHGASWSSIVNLDAMPLMNMFRDKYPHLPWNREELPA